MAIACYGAESLSPLWRSRKACNLLPLAMAPLRKAHKASAVRNRRRIRFASQTLKVRPQPLARLRLLQ